MIGMKRPDEASVPLLRTEAEASTTVTMRADDGGRAAMCATTTTHSRRRWLLAATAAISALSVAGSAGIRATRESSLSSVEFCNAFKAVVLVRNGPEMLKKTLTTLRDADYGEDSVDVEVRLNSPAMTQTAQTVANELGYNHGRLTITASSAPPTRAQAWYTSWMPVEDTECAVILEDDVDLSPHWYKWLKQAWVGYHTHSEVAGISLHRQNFVAQLPGRTKEFGADGKPFMYPYLGDGAFSPHPEVWKSFLAWIKQLPADFDPATPDLITYQWMKARGKQEMWTQYFIYFCIERGYRNVYVNLPGGVALASRRPGALPKPGDGAAQLGTEVAPLLGKDAATNFLFPMDMMQLNWGGNVVSHHLGFDAIASSTLKTLVTNINKSNGFVYLLFTNDGFIEMTKSWMCNVRRLNRAVLANTVIVAESYNTVRTLSDFEPSCNYFVYTTDHHGSVSYGHYDYYRVVLDRMVAQNIILSYGATVMIVESDQIWNGDITPNIRQKFNEGFDVIAGDERAYTHKRDALGYFCAGFYGIHNRQAAFFKKYEEGYGDMLNKFKDTTGSIAIENDQERLNRVVKGNSTVKAHTFDRCVYASGQWYGSQQYQTECPNPTILHNNYVIGNKVKMDRAKKHNQWFFNGDECTDGTPQPAPPPPAPADGNGNAPA